jgi:hypothetical protein
MGRSFLLLLVLSFIGFTSGAQQINRAEYFIDTDNGVGTGTPITITTAGNQVNQSFTIPVNSISQGFHRLGVRCRNTNGTWSQQFTSLFYILSSSTAGSNANINRAEYFVDTDPGLGAGIPISVTSPGLTINQNVAINIGALSQGFHRLVFRVQNTNGTWSEQLSNLFYVLPPAPVAGNANITRAEYFIDTDPGVGNGTQIPPFTAGASVSSAFSIPVNTLSQGFHRLNVRIRNGDRTWSHHSSSLFYVLPNEPTAQQQQIVAAEWFVDADPGIGNGTAITPINAGNNINVLTDISVASLNLIDPNHTLSIRVKDQTGKWSLHLAAPFQICQPTSTANFSFSSPCPNQAVIFTNSSTNVPIGATYQWDFNNDGVVDANGIGPHQFTYATAGNFNAVLRIIEENCIAQVNKAVSVPAVSPPTINVTGNNTTICEGTTVELSTNFGSAYSWSNGAGNTQQVNVGPGTYTVNVTYTNGCSATSAPVTINAAPSSSVSITAGGPTSFCPGGTVELTANPASGTYQWNTGQTTRTITVSGAGTYTATITPTGSCLGTASVVVSLLPTPTVNAGSNVSIALGQSTTLTATGAVSYVWSPAATLNTTVGASVIATPTQTTFYSVQGTGANGCVGNDQVLVTVVQSNASFTGLLASYCNNAPSSTLSGTPAGGTFSGPGISGNIFNPANTEVSGNVTITYTVVNELGETISSSQTTNILQAPQASISVQGSATVCAPNTITLTASGGNTYQWVGGPAAQQFTVSSTGNYTVNVFNANGCQASASQAVTINPQPLANISADGPTTFCQGGQVQLTSNTGASYLWSPGGQTTQSIVVSTVGNYTVQVTNTLGCSNTSLPTAVNVTTSPTAPIIQTSGNTSICAGNSVTLVSNNNDVIWFRQGNVNAIGSGASIQVNQAGVYFARFESSCGSINSNTIQVDEVTSIAPTFSTINPICVGATAPLLATISNNGISGTWNPSIVSNQLSNDYVFTPNGGQCAQSLTISVTVNALPMVDAGADVSITAGSSTTLIASGAQSYVWSPSTGLNVNNTASVIASPNTTTTYTVAGTNAAGCLAQDQVLVTVTQPTTASFTGLAANYCLNSSPSALTGSPAGGVFSGPGISGNTFNPSTAGTGVKTITYTFTGTEGTIQTSQNTTVTLAENTTVTVSICPGETYTLPNGQVVGVGTYQTQTDNGNGCFSVLTTTVNALPTLVWYEDNDEDGFGNPNASLTACAQPTGYVSNAQDCNDANATINPASQTLTFSGTGNFSNAILFPQTGSPSTLFTFSVVYTDVNGSLPPFGFPRAIFDYEGNGVFSNVNDRTILLSDADVNDLNTIDGKVYTGTISALTAGTNYQARIQVQSSGCITQIGPFNYPDVLTEPDLEIFANDISFSNPTPPVSSPLQVSAVIRNISDFPAANFIVSLTNQFDPTIEYPEISVPFLAANSSTTVVWNITTPDVPAWCPMEVFVDHTNVIIESNELDNRAVRPFVNGNFILPGGIAVAATASPAVQFVAPLASITVSGYAEYFDTAVPLNDPSVAGATVSLIAANGAQYFGTTNSSGFFSISFPISALTPGTFTITGEVTDFTLTGPFQVSYQIIPNPQPQCLPDLISEVILSDYQIFPDESISGSVTVKNIGCAPTTTTTLLDITQTGGLPTINDVAVPPLAVGASFTTTFSNITFNQVGTYLICGTADASFLVQEISESNNTSCKSVQVVPPLPDITPISFNVPPLFLCNNPANPTLTIQNIGYVATGAFDYSVNVYFNGVFDQTFNFTRDNLDAQSAFNFTVPYVFANVGSYSFEIIGDTPLPNGVVTEISELNNVGFVNFTIVPCKPDLVVLGCGELNVDPAGVIIPGTVTYSAKVQNAGNATAFGPVAFEFVLSNGEVYPLTYADDIAPNQTVTFTTSAPAVASSNTLLTAVVDPNNAIDEFSNSNNQYADVLCYEFEVLPPCGGLFPATYAPNQTMIPYIGFRSNNLYKASALTVRFEVSGPGISGSAQLGDVILNDVSKNCFCPTVVSLPNSFLFTEVGTYIFTFTVDPDGVYSECNENNNVYSYPVNVTNFPDYRILSQFINPTLLNPDVNESVFFDITYENIGVSNILNQPDLSVFIDEVPFATINNLPGLINGQNITIAVPNSYSSDLPGVHVVRAVIDSQNEVQENSETNNEATRAFVVGSAANLFFVSFEPSDASPSIDQPIDINAIIQNNGDVAVNADVRISYLDNANNAIEIGVIPISLDAGESTPITLPWIVLDNNTTLLGAIVNVSELEFNSDDNFASAFLSAFDVQLTSIPFCEGGSSGSISASASNGTAPYTYVWNSGFVGETLQAAPGQYSVTVTDAQGVSATASGSIGIDASCVVQTCQISPVSYTVAPTCNQASGLYDAALTVTYQTAPTEGFITVNGNNFAITGSPQTFNLSFGEGPIAFNVAFTEAPACSLMLITGENRGPCLSPCPPDETFNVFICQGDEYTLPNGEVVTSSGEYVVEISENNCNYTITTNLQVVPSGNSTVNVNVCPGETYTLPNGDEVGAGEYTLTIGSGFGCSSTITTIVTLIQSGNVTQSANICAGELFTLPNGVIVSPSETTTYTIPSVNAQTGCNFQILFTVLVNENPGNSTINESICAGESYELPDGQLVTSANTYVVNLTTQNGCPYTFTVNLTVNPSPSSTVDVSINAGENYTLPDGIIVSQAGQYVSIIQTELGCNNTITTNLTVINLPGGCYATSVIASNTLQGNRKNGMPVLAVRSNTSEVLGAPDPVINNVVNFYSLGFTGYITVKFDQPVANGPGDDIRVYEATWNNRTCNNYPERAEVFGSQDGCNFLYMGDVCHTDEVGIPAEMQWIQYVQVRDISNVASFTDNDDGYDVAAVECLHGASNSTTFADLTPGTLQDIPTYLPGNTKNNNMIPQNRRIKEQAIGMPGGNGINFVSLGFGGNLIGKFDFVVFNKEGLDLQVVETSFGNPLCNNYPEKAQIAVSKNGIDFTPLSETCLDGTMEIGTNAWIQYVRIVDSSPLSSTRFNGAADGFDVDAVVDLHACSNGTNSRMINQDNVTEPDAEWTVNLYPNPTSDRANLELVDLPNDELITYELFDATGRLLFQQKHQLIDGQINISIDMKHLAMGSYQVRIITSVGLKVLKLIKMS